MVMINKITFINQLIELVSYEKFCLYYKYTTTQNASFDNQRILLID